MTTSVLARVAGLAALALTLPALAGLAPSALASATAVKCPKVNAVTLAVTPVPAPGVDWSGCNLSNANLNYAALTGANLSGANFTGALLEDASLSKANLSRAELSNDNMSYTDLTGANAQGAHLSGAVLEYTSAGANFASADLAGADISLSTLAKANLGGANLTGTVLRSTTSGGITGTPQSLPVNWSLVGGYLLGPSAALENSDLAGLNLGPADLQDADLMQANLSKTELAAANLVDAETSGIVGTPASLPPNWELLDGYLIGPQAYVGYANLAGADLANDDLAGAEFGDATLTGADLAGANLAGTSFAGATLTDVGLDGAQAATANFNGVTSGGITGTPASLNGNDTLYNGYLVAPSAQLRGANLAGADLTGKQLGDANLTNADLSDADLTNASLYSATLTGANLTGASLAGAAKDLVGIKSGGITGNPATLATGWALTDGYLIGEDAYLEHASLGGADLSGDDLHGAELAFSTLTGADLSGDTMTGAVVNLANLTGADLTGVNFASGEAFSANLSTTTLTNANFAGVELTKASLDGAVGASTATWTSAEWGDTTCPDGANSNSYVAGCFSALDTTPPAALPTITGTAGLNGWYISPLTVSWNWTDNGTVDASACTEQSYSGSQQGSSVKLTATCQDLAGNMATASLTVKIDLYGPQVTVTGIRKGAVYALGRVPSARCPATSVAGITRAAVLAVAIAGTHGVGAGTATCAKAVDGAGLSQRAAARVTFTVAYGFDDFVAPAPGATFRLPQIIVRFRLDGANGKALATSLARALASAHKIRVTMSGPHLAADRALCQWQASVGEFSCRIVIPSNVPSGARHRYTLTIAENLGTGWVTAPARGRHQATEAIYYG
jgi:uncharacterized protein YjbI with pentapeptide repeats